MPYDNDKSKEVSSSGKKSVTKRSSASSGGKSTSGTSRTNGTKAASSQTAKSKVSSAKAKSSTSRSAQQGTKKASSSAARPKQASKTQNTKAKSRQGNSARDDYKLFSENVKRTERSEKAAAAKRSVQSSKKTGSAQKSKGKSQSRSKLTTALTYIMIVFAFIALMVTLSLTVFFKIESIKVTVDGTKFYSESRITELSGIEEGQNIFSVDANKIEKNIEKTMPYIEDCEIKRSFPTGIKIKAESAQPAGVITLQNGMRIVVSIKGKSLEVLAPYDGSAASDTDAAPALSNTDTAASGTDIDSSETDMPADSDRNDHSAYIDETKLPEIIGLSISDGMDPGEYIVAEDETALATLENIMELLRKYELPPTKIDLSAGKLYAYYDNRIIIKIGSGAELETKIQLAADIIHNKLSEYDSGRVDVTNPNKGYFTPEYLLNK